MEEECLYKMTTKFTLEEYKRYNYAILKKRHHFLILAIFELFVILFGVTSQNAFLFVFAIIYPLILYIVQENNIKKVFKSNKIVQNIDVHYEFYKDYLIEKNENGEMKVEYSKLDEVIETKTNFYLMIAKNQGYMISKADMPSGLDEFIRKMRKA